MTHGPRFMLHIETDKGLKVVGPFTGSWAFGGTKAVPPKAVSLVTDLVLAGKKCKWVREA